MTGVQTCALPIFIRSFWANFPVPFAQTKNWSNLAMSGVATFDEDPAGELLYCSITGGTCFQIVKP